jgi:hypothetical protein
MFRKLFINHCEEAGESYAEHLAFTLRTSWELLCIGAILLTHGLLPCVFTTTASSRIKKLYNKINERSQNKTTSAEIIY